MQRRAGLSASWRSDERKSMLALRTCLLPQRRMMQDHTGAVWARPCMPLFWGCLALCVLGV